MWMAPVYLSTLLPSAIKCERAEWRESVLSAVLSQCSVR